MNEEWTAWVDGADDDSVTFTVSAGEDVIEAASSVLNNPARDTINVWRAP